MRAQRSEAVKEQVLDIKNAKVGEVELDDAIFGLRPIKALTYRLPAKARRVALRQALSQKRAEGKLIVVDDLPAKEMKTKPMAEALKMLGVVKGLIVVAEPNEVLKRSVRNIKNVHIVPCQGLNVYDLFRFEHAVITRPALEKVQEVLKP